MRIKKNLYVFINYVLTILENCRICTPRQNRPPFSRTESGATIAPTT
jgi:hypothetical protein